MAETSHIEWTDATWNPVTGCSVVSPGCTNCYAMKLAGTRLKHHPSRAGLTKGTKAGPVWTGEVRLNEQWLGQPLRWARPRMIFVCAHGDLFHEDVPDTWIDRVFAVMALSPQHTFQVLTKRSKRMRAYFEGRRANFGRASDELQEMSHSLDEEAHQLAADRLDFFDSSGIAMRNVWLGVSAERQQEADARIPDLLATPAAIRFVSLEPLLGPIDLQKVPANGGASLASSPSTSAPAAPCLSWVIVGGESGPDARPMHPDWARSLRDQCAAAHVPFFFKQWGSWGVIDADAFDLDALDRLADAGGVHIFPDLVEVHRVGKKAAGRLLYGVEHSAMPAPPAATQRELPL